jgi:hypothetical protein
MSHTALRRSILACALAASGPLYAAPTYVDAIEHLGWPEAYAWYDLTDRLQRDFDSVCGDTFCEGEFSNIQAMGYRCSVEDASGAIGECGWTFTAANQDVDPRNGALLIDARHWQCRTALPKGTTLATLMRALDVDHPLDAALPGGRDSIYDGLTECL